MFIPIGPRHHQRNKYYIIRLFLLQRTSGCNFQRSTQGLCREEKKVFFSKGFKLVIIHSFFLSSFGVWLLCVIMERSVRKGCIGFMGLSEQYCVWGSSSITIVVDLKLCKHSLIYSAETPQYWSQEEVGRFWPNLYKIPVSVFFLLLCILGLF